VLDDPPRRSQVVLLVLLVEGGLGGLAVGLGWLIDCPPWQDIRWDWWDSVLAVGATLPLLVIFLLCLRFPVGPLARIKAFAEDVIQPVFRTCTLLDLAAISLLAGVGEELFFRGLLQGFFSRWFHPYLSLAVASMLFGLLHAITPTYALLAALIGAYLGWLYIHIGNLVVPITAHALYDAFALTYLVRGRRADHVSVGKAQSTG
jgi:uncharacterized protein